MAEKDPSDLFVDTLKDIYYAEKQIYKALPKDGEGGKLRSVAGSLREASR